MTVWMFLISFPLLFGGPVTARIESVTSEQCSRVRNVMVRQLESHRSNATVGDCLVAPGLTAKDNP